MKVSAESSMPATPKKVIICSCSVTQFIEFPSEGESVNDGAAKSRDKNAPQFGESMTLEQLLVTKNKKLQADITALKVRTHQILWTERERNSLLV